ncbi:MAG: hypothetical protein Q8P39_03365 [Candidatus Yanofskybacteria bacterium]|nr:hypothetical protein [Candidatus Yanofskybacteria bacterium]
MKKRVFFFLLGCAVFGIPAVAFAQQGLVPCGGQGNPCELMDIFRLLNNIIRFFLIPDPNLNGRFAIVPLLATLFTVIGGAHLLLGGNNPGLLQRGNEILKATVIGLVIIYGAWLFIGALMTGLGVAEWTGLRTWFEIIPK